jgi:hypothetical protein
MRSPAVLSALLMSVAVCGGCVEGKSEVSTEEKQRLQAYILDQAPSDIEHKLGINYSDKVTLLGYKLTPQGLISPGQKLKLTLYWECKASLDEGWNLFTHVLDGSGERILNVDNVGPLREWRQTRQALWPSAWTPGRFYVDEQEFAVPRNVKTRNIQIVTGIWKGTERLAIRSGPKDRERRGIVANVALRGVAERERVRSTRVPRLRVDRSPTKTRIKIDGRLDDPAWKTARTTGPFVNVSTGEPNTNPDLGGWVKLLWTEQALYLGFNVQDARVVGGFDPKSQDPHLWTKDTVEIMVDPDGDGDNRDYYEIQINPQNLVFDSRFDSYNRPRVEPDGPFGHQQWSANLQSAVVVRGTIDDNSDRDQGYVVEARLAWQALDRAAHAPPRPGDTWRMNFYVIQQNSGVSWSPILGQGNFHKASRFGRVLWAEPGWSPPRDSYSPPPPAGSAGAQPRAGSSGKPRTPRRPITGRSGG